MFEEIIGNNNIKEELINSVKTKRTSHSYLFVGKSGIGKKLIAKEFAKMLLCLDENKYCGKCKSCIEFSSNNNPDFFLIEAENGSIKIDQIREVQRRVAEKPIISEKKVYIIDGADLMTVEAQNCLLKTLEEPPEYITIILIATNESELLSTIKSRCTIIHFKEIEDEKIKEYLEKNYGTETIAPNILKMFGGSIGKAITLKDNSLLYGEVDKVIKLLETNDIIDVLKAGESLYKIKDDIYDVLEYINIVLLELSKKNYKYANCIEIVENTKRRLKANSNYNMCIDYMLFNMWGEINEKYSRS